MSTNYLKTIVLISISVSVFLIFGFFGTLREQTADSTEKENRTAEIPITRKKRVKIGNTRAPDSLAEFQSSVFYRTIVDNNLFRPLGWHPPRLKEPYRLLGTRTPTDGKSEAQAILQSTTEGRTYTISLGETLDPDTTVVGIQPKQVTLEKAGVRRTLYLNATPLLK